MDRRKLIMVILTAVLGISIAYSFMNPNVEINPESFTKIDKTAELVIDGMSCMSCTQKISNRLNQNKDLNIVSLDHSTGLLKLNYQVVFHHFSTHS